MSNTKETIQITLTMEKFSGFAWRHSDCFGTIKDDSDNEIGGAGATIGGNPMVTINGVGSFICSPVDLWNAVCQAVGKHELVFNQPTTNNETP